MKIDMNIFQSQPDHEWHLWSNARPSQTLQKSWFAVAASPNAPFAANGPGLRRGKGAALESSLPRTTLLNLTLEESLIVPLATSHSATQWHAAIQACI